MRVLLTGGSGDLGFVLTPRLLERGDEVVILDLVEPKRSSKAEFIKGSVTERDKLAGWFSGCDAIVHIAAWHGIHEFKKEKNAYDFFDLNVKGTFEVFEAAVAVGINKVVFISSTRISDQDTVYGNSKIIAEQLASFYAMHHHMRVVTLRPRAFIPHWNRAVYEDYVAWAKWFWKGAVHIDDVALAVERSLEFIQNNFIEENLIATVDGAYEFTDDDLKNWDADGPYSTFRKHYSDYCDLAISHGLAPNQPPRKLEYSRAAEMIGYQPKFSLKSLLEDLKKYGTEGPPA